MQLQIECNPTLLQTHLCFTCNRLFEMQEAQVIVCNDQGSDYGDICPKCVKRGFNWLSDRFEQVTAERFKVVQLGSRERYYPLPSDAKMPTSA